MVKLQVVTQEVTIESQSTKISAHLALPAGVGQFPGIIVLQEIFGVNTHIRNVTASFYGRGITTFTPGGGEPSVSQTGSIAGTIYMFFGMDDASIPPEHIAEIDLALTQHDIPHQIWQYPGAEHGFCCDLRASYNPTAAESAWQHVEELFQQLTGSRL